MQYNKKRYRMINKEIIKERLMGPDCTIIIDELIKEKETNEEIRILDLGCGKGLTSIYLAEKYKNAEIFAVDLWVDAGDNYIFFKEYKLDNRIIPLNCDAEKLPFAENYFDMIVSVDAYHYFGLGKDYFKYNIKPLLKKNGEIYIAVPGIKNDYEKLPEELEHYIKEDDFRFFKSIEYWDNLLKKDLKDIKIHEMKCFNEAWQNWLSCDNPYAVEDIELLKADNGKFLNFISIKGKI